MKPRPPKSLRSTMEKTILFSSLFGFVVILVAASLIAYYNARRDHRRQQELTHATITELILPALKVSDYSEIRKILTLVSPGSDLTTVITKDGDILLSDYDQLANVQSLVNPIKDHVNCSRLMSRVRGSLIRGVSPACTEVGGASVFGEPQPMAVLLSVNSDRLFSLLPSLFLPLCLIGLGGTLIVFAAFRIAFARRVLVPFEALVERIRRQIESPLEVPPAGESRPETPEELQNLEAGFRSLVDAARREHEKAKALEKSTALFELANQVAHDIRSPLAALNVEIVEAQGAIPEGSRKRLSLVAARIKDIAEKLLISYRSQSTALTGIEIDRAPERSAVYPLELLIEELLAEKNLEFSHQGVSLRFLSPNDHPAASAWVEPMEFKRVLSNLINNAVEAMGHLGTVDIRLRVAETTVEVRVKDRGKGIPPAILPRLMQKGATFGKEKGSGLGLYHARTTVERWGGELLLSSEEGIGTEVAITLPRRESPAWFAHTLAIRSRDPVVLLDDDPTMHAFWQRKLAAAPVPPLGFASPAEFISWFKSDPRARAAQFLFDQDLGPDQPTGLALIEQLGIAARTTLVTGSLIDEPLIRQCQRLGVRILPKALAAEARLVDGDALPRAWGQVLSITKTQTGGNL